LTQGRHFHPHSSQPDQLRRAVDFAREETQKRESLNTRFSALAARTSTLVGSAWMFIVAIAIIILWGISGPLFHFSDTWQLIINTGTTIITFLVVFMIQNTQNRDSRAIHLKLDEIIRVLEHARNEMVDVEDKEDEVLDRYQEEFRHLEDIVDPTYKHRHKRPAVPQRARDH
jgi:low affinity Fe/Cu permease